MPSEILMPALSPTMEEGKLVKWLVREGDRVRAGDVIAEIETDKATMEVEAAEDGKLGTILVAEGSEHVPVNQPIALLLTDGEDAAEASSFETRPAAAPQGEAPAREPPPLRTLRRALQRPSRRVRGLKQSKPFPPHPNPLRSGERERPANSARACPTSSRRRRVRKSRRRSRGPRPRSRPAPKWCA